MYVVFVTSTLPLTIGLWMCVLYAVESSGGWEAEPDSGRSPVSVLLFGAQNIGESCLSCYDE